MQNIVRGDVMDWVNIGKRIRNQRELLGFTREKLAEKLEITPKFCSDIELGLKGMSIATLCRISDTLCLPVDYILFGESSNGNNCVIEQMINSCPQDKKKYLEDIIKAFLLSTKN